MENLLNKEPVQRVLKVLSDFDESLKVETLSSSARTAKDAAESLKTEVGSIVKSLLLRRQSAFLLCLVAGDKRCSLNKVKKLLNEKDCGNYETLLLLKICLILFLLSSQSCYLLLFLVPLLFSEAVNLHPVAILLAILFFGGLWGLWGVFFAIPLATLIKAVLNAWPSNLQTPAVD